MSHLRNLTVFKQKSAQQDVMEGPVLDTARVLKSDNAEYLLLTESTEVIKAGKAAGCFLEPEENDTVLIARGTAHGTYILTVLRRSGDVGRIKLDGKITMSVEAGQLKLTGDSVKVEAPLVALTGVTSEIKFLNLLITAGRVGARLGKLSAAASVVEIAAKRISQRVKDSFRRVSRIDRTRAGQVSVQAEERYDLKAGEASILAENNVKIDGEKIKLG